MILFGIWHEKTQGPRHLQAAMNKLEAAGLGNAQVRRKWSLCPKGSKGYAWRTAEAEGYVCSYSRKGPVIMQRFKPGAEPSA